MLKLKSVKTFAALVIGLASLATNAQAACSTASFVGNWGFAGQGTDVSAGNISYSAIGNFTFVSTTASGAAAPIVSGYGALSISENGVLYPNISHKVTSVVVDPNTCKGTLTVVDASGLNESFTFMILNGGVELSLMNNDGKHIGILTAKKAF